MLMEVGYFCEMVEKDLAGLIDKLISLTNRESKEEILSWQNSLPKLSVALSDDKLKDFHISLGQSGSVSLEYKLPAASAWCDAVLLGNGENVPSAVMIEIKGWDTRKTAVSNSECLVVHRGITHSHPSDQVRGYVEYCKHFHSAIIKNNADVSGCAFFTSSKDLSVFHNEIYKTLVREYPVFSSESYNANRTFADFLSNKLHKPNYDFAEQFENGYYAQSRNLVEQIAKYINDKNTTMFVLLDEQRKGFEMCLSELQSILSKSDPGEKAVIIIEGPPGSGKSVLAAQLWAALVEDNIIQGSVVMTSTSSSQHSNWEKLFQKQSKRRVGRGVIVKSNQYNPGLTSHWIKAMRSKGYELQISDWRNNIKLYLAENKSKMHDENIAVSIVDEAHALIDPSVEGRNGVGNSGWCMQAGPQGYHIIRSSKISIFLMDAEQSYRDNETTDKNRIVEWANELSVKHVPEISLGDAQFRCGGSKEYVSWLENVLFHKNNKVNDLSWRKKPDGSGSFKFEIVNTPAELDEKLTPLHEKGNCVRLVSSYGRQWKTKKATNPHDLPPEEKDFYIPYSIDESTKYWSKIWNYTPKASYYYFIQAPEGTRMHKDPLCEVGCSYVVRGFDFDYLGVIWLKDLIWRKDRWMVNVDDIYESAWKITLSRAKKETSRGILGPDTAEIIHNLQKGYRILLSRAVKGIYIWFEDQETRQHIENILNKG